MSLLSVEKIRKSFAGIQAVSDVSFTLEAGEMLALIGPNGAGKSTCFNMLNGQLRPDGGSIKLTVNRHVYELAERRPRDIWRLGVGRTFQVAATFGSMSVLENVQMSLISRQQRIFSWWASAARSYRDEALYLLEQVGMAHHAKRQCGTLAYGDVKRVELAIALGNTPKLLLMDEPTAGMAPGERNQLMELTKRIVTDRNMAVLFTEHSMDVVFAHASRSIVLARGQLIANGTIQEIRSCPKVREVYFGSGRSFEAKVAA